MLSRPDVQRLLDEHGLAPSRALGQNFVVDPNTVRRIARLAGIEPGDRVVEIGAGLGSLTLALAEAGAEVTAVEIDRRLIPVLGQVLAPVAGHVEVVEGDALTIDWPALLGNATGLTLVANLPYNVATPVVLRVLEEAPQIDHLVVMVQREVAERLAAGAGDDAYGAVSVRIAYFARASLVARVPPTVFVPRPKVDSALVEIRRRPAPAVDPTVVSYRDLVRVVRAGFAQRRKMLRRSLAGVVAPEAFAASGVAPSARAEELDVEAWGRLAAGSPPEGPEGEASS
ncbi:MAG TPA: 16S rRNA (adenine(1518)-N(6)/adenine(1519)-N(6))-dimethyltransferase RsmA [Acidimicrobiales bacterium]|nr:16S rRNA (adenine(1518)-N(6)/adenine(1519)-N(6))-dimethyltransferase RsmA [Acidimicrobiales bacterium]